MLAHRAVHGLGLGVIFQILQVVEILLRLDKLRSHHDHLDGLLLDCWGHLVGLGGYRTRVLRWLVFLLGQAIGSLLPEHINLLSFHSLLPDIIYYSFFRLFCL